MTDADNKHSPEKFGDNPFRTLSKSAFPNQQAKQKKRPVPATPLKNPEPATDAALFLQSMQGTSPLESTRRIAPEDAQQADWNTFVKEMKSPAMPAKKRKKHVPPSIQPPQAQKPDETESLHDFAKAMRDVQPLDGRGRDIAPLPETLPSATAQHSFEYSDILKGSFEFALQYTDEYVEGHVVGLDLITLGKLQAGQFSPEAHLDLHGLNALQAYQRLVGFLRSAYMRNQRTVLLVTGRGLNSPNGMPVLRDKMQTWLTQEPFRRVVLAFCTAQTADGGAGALYVLLRKFRKDHGKVQWDRVPVDPDLLMD